MNVNFKQLRKPFFITAAVVWVVYIFMAKGMGEGFMAAVLFAVMLIFLNL
ncbi:MAG: hypothetical protein PVG75_03965 [Thioalkalispiraceae bacterium]|jgi:hypothetical protein